MKLTAFTQIIVTLAVTAWVFILPVEAVATILVLELALLLYIKHDRMTMAAIGGLAVFTGMMILLQLLFGSPLDVSLTGGLRMLVMTMAFLCLLAEIRVLKNVRAPHFFLSHSEPFQQNKEDVLEWMEAIYEKRKRDESYIKTPQRV